MQRRDALAVLQTRMKQRFDSPDYLDSCYDYTTLADFTYRGVRIVAQHYNKTKQVQFRAIFKHSRIVKESSILEACIKRIEEHYLLCSWEFVPRRDYDSIYGFCPVVLVILHSDSTKHLAKVACDFVDSVYVNEIIEPNTCSNELACIKTDLKLTDSLPDAAWIAKIRMCESVFDTFSSSLLYNYKSAVERAVKKLDAPFNYSIKHVVEDDTPYACILVTTTDKDMQKALNDFLLGGSRC